MKSTIRGMFMLGRGKPEGIHQFSNSSDSVLSALAPWIALAAVSNLLPLFFAQFKNTQELYVQISLFLLKICGLLLTVSILHAYSVLWKTESNWKQTAAAALWCLWVPVIDCILFVMIAGLFFGSMPNILLFLLGLASILYIAYSVWLNWFVIKVGLGITAQKSIIIIVTCIVATIAIYGIFVACNYSYMMQVGQELRQQMQQQAQSIHQ